jgi:hypothetical protein
VIAHCALSSALTPKPIQRILGKFQRQPLA